MNRIGERSFNCMITNCERHHHQNHQEADRVGDRVDSRMENEILKPLVDEIPRDRHCQHEGNDQQEEEITVNELQNVTHSRAQNFANADFFHFSLHGKEYESIDTQAGYQDSDERKAFDNTTEV